MKVYSYGGRASALWWGEARDRLERADNLDVIDLPADASRAMAALAQRNMRLQCTIQDGLVWLDNGEGTAQVEPVMLKGRPQGKPRSYS